MIALGFGLFCLVVVAYWIYAGWRMVKFLDENYGDRPKVDRKGFGFGGL